MLNTITNKLGWLKRAYNRNQNRKATIEALSELNDFELNDIGVCRGDIGPVARGDKTYRKTY